MPNSIILILTPLTFTIVLDKDDIILIFGSMNANADDRTITRSEVRTLQYIDSELNLHSTSLFQSWGELGLSSMVFLPGSTRQFFITTGKHIFLIDFDADEVVKPVMIPKLRGVHEISIIKNQLWISNTYFDEVICYDYVQETVKQRLKLTADQIQQVDEKQIDPEDTIRINKFHCNQIFEGFDGKEYLLVHHVTGEQIVKKVAQKLIKSQGGGGVLHMPVKKAHKLKMKAPHSVRWVEGQYWVFDSGHGELDVYDQAWKLVQKIDIGGWGRGGCYLKHTRTFFAGISSPRRRYLKFLDTTPKKNKVLAINSDDKSIRSAMEIDHIEQVNNLYHVKRTFLEELLRIKPLLDQYEPQ